METRAQRKKKRRLRTPPPPSRKGIPVVALVRMFGIGGVSILACIYALVRYYTVPREPMLVPAASATEVEIEWTPGSPVPLPFASGSASGAAPAPSR